MTFRDLLGLRPKADTVAALRASLTDTQTALASVRSIAATLEVERGAILLDASPAEAEEHEGKLMAARAEAERLAAIAGALPARITAAEERERAAELDQLAAQTEADAAAGAALARQAVEALAHAADLMRQHDELEGNIEAANRTLRHGGCGTVAVPFRRLWPDPANASPVRFGFDKAELNGGGSGLFVRAQGFSGATVAQWVAKKAARG